MFSFTAKQYKFEEVEMSADGRAYYTESSIDEIAESFLYDWLMELEAENVKPIRRYDKEGFIYNSNDGTTLHIGMERDDNDYEELRWHMFLEL